LTAGEDEWRLAINDAGRFLDQWASRAIEFGWTAGELFDVPRDGRPGGFIWFIQGERIEAFGPQVAEVDGGYFGGYVKPANHRENRRDRRLARNQTGKHKAVVIIRERNGRSLPAVFRTEGQALSFIRSRIAKGTIVNADESSSWDALHARFEMKRVNHEDAYSMDGACTNWAEEFFSRMRRAEQGHHHHIAGPYLLRYAQEASWREDNRRISNGDQAHAVSGLAMKRGPSVDFCGYWPDL
jgi:hypothetical protein